MASAVSVVTGTIRSAPTAFRRLPVALFGPREARVSQAIRERRHADVGKVQDVEIVGRDRVERSRHLVRDFDEPIGRLAEAARDFVVARARGEDDELKTPFVELFDDPYIQFADRVVAKILRENAEANAAQFQSPRLCWFAG